MSKLFTLVGPCSNYNLDDMLSQAITMITNAQSKIDDVTSATIITPFTPDSRAANNGKNLFGNTFTWKKSLDSASKARLSQVRGNFELLHSALQDGNGLGFETNFFVCTDSTLSYIDDISELGPVQGGGNVITTMYGGGVWTDQSLRDDQGTVKFTIRASNQPICGGGPGQVGLIAETFHANQYSQTKTFVFCPTAFDTTKYKASLAAYVSTDLGKTASVDDYRSLPGVFIHEMFHWYDKFGFVDKKVNSKTGAIVPAYFFDRCFELAQEVGNNDCVTNTDSYRLYAESCYISNTRWMAPAPTK